MDSFWGNIFKREEQQDTRTLLKQTPIFATLTRRELDAIERIMYRREYDADEVIFRQDEPGVGMYVIERGAVTILLEPTGEVLADLHAGEFFGEIALLNETPRSATAKARTPCTLWGLFQPELLDLLDRNPRLGVKLLLPLARIAGQRLLHTDQRVQALRDELNRCKAATETPPDNASERHDGATNPALD